MLPNTLADSANDSWLNRMRIGPRLGLNTALPLLLFAGFSVWLWLALGAIRVDVQSHLTEQVEMTLRAKAVELRVVEVQQFLTDISATRGQDGLADGFDKAAKAKEAFLADLATLERYFKTHGESSAVERANRVRSDFELYYAEGVRMARAYVEGGPAKGNPMMAGFDSAAEALHEGVEALAQSATEDMRKEVAGVAADTQQLRLWAVGLCVGVLLAAAFTAWRISLSITSPIAHGVQALGRVAEGDLSGAVSVRGRDEAAELMRALRDTQSALVRIVASVRAGAQAVASASEQIARGNQDLAQRTQEQAAALEQTAASAEHFGEGVGQNAASARQADEMARQASGIASQGGAVVAQVVDTMRGINDSSRKIADITGVIDGIAFQTNILALNAAVEAARAGEAGRGFAVVASEVRALAQRSAEAAREIKGLITASVSRVEKGTELADAAGHTMSEIVAAIGRVTAIMGEISTASSGQDAGVRQLRQAIEQMDQVTQQNAALVEESAVAAESLSEQAKALLTEVDMFRLGLAAEAPYPFEAKRLASARAGTPFARLPAPSASA